MNRQSFTGVAKSLLYASGAVHVARKVGANDGVLRILAYHSVSPPNAYCTDTIRVSPALFDTQIAYLRKHYSIVSLDQAVGFLRDGRPLPKNAVAITFDDGYLDNYQYALPILKKHGASATFFVVSSVVKDNAAFWVSWLQQAIVAAPNIGDLRQKYARDVRSDSLQALIDAISVGINMGGRAQREVLLNEVADAIGCARLADCQPTEMMSLEQVREMARQGMCIGSHSKTHAIASSLPDEELEDELGSSKRDLEEALQQPIMHLAFPNGPGVVNCNNRTASFASEAGYDSAATSRRGVIRQGSNRYLLERHSIHEIMRVGPFAYKLEEHQFPYLALAGAG